MHRLDVGLLARLGGEHEGGSKRHVHLREGRIRTLHRARPQPSNDGELLADERLQVRPLLRHLRRDLDLRIEMTDALLRLVAHPLAVVAHVLGEPLRAVPLSRIQRLLCSRFRVHRWLAGELRRNLNHCLVDQHRHRIEVAGVALQAEPLRFERQRAAAGEGVVEGGELVPIE